MKILFLTNNPAGKNLYQWLLDQGQKVELTGDKLDKNYLVENNYDLLISYGYRYIIKKNVIESFNNRIINLHISLLPWNKGADPNIWSFLEDTPKGVTIHLIDEGIDTGPVLYQREIAFDDKNETLATSYNKLNRLIQGLFKEKWPEIETLEFSTRPQEGEGTIHFIKDMEKIKFLVQEKGWDTPVVELKNNYNKYLDSYENS